MDRNDGQQQFEQIPCPLEHISSAFQSLDTVRALHHTVVSLRSALEDAHKEIDNLKKQISIQTDIDDGKVYRREDLETVKKIVDADQLVADITSNIVEEVEQGERKNLKTVEFNIDEVAADLKVKEDTKEINKGDKNPSVEETKIRKKQVKPKEEGTKVKEVVTKEKENIIEEDELQSGSPRKKSRKITKGKYDITTNKSPKNVHSERISVMPDVRIITNPSSDRKHKQMASKIDVKIKVSSNIQVAGTTSASDTTTSDTNSGKNHLLFIN